LTNAARLYASMASRKDEAPSLRLEEWTKARAFYQRSQDLCSELNPGGKREGADRRLSREIARELARCNDSLAKLEQAH